MQVDFEIEEGDIDVDADADADAGIDIDTTDAVVTSRQGEAVVVRVKIHVNGGKLVQSSSSSASSPTSLPHITVSPLTGSKRSKRPLPLPISSGNHDKPQDDIANTEKETAKQSSLPSSSSSLSQAQDQAQGEQQAKKRGRKRKPTRVKESKALQFTWICTECRESECATDVDAPLLVCEGLCNRPFHIPCANLPEGKIPAEDETWICGDCKDERHQCAVCHEYGRDNIDVHKCEKKDCGLFFHEACLNMYDNVSVTIVPVDTDTAKSSSGILINTTRSRTCIPIPSHTHVKSIDPDTSSSAIEITVSSKKSQSLEDIGNDENCNQNGSEKNINNNNNNKGSNNGLQLENITADQNSQEEQEVQHHRIKFSCPAHTCWTCSGGMPPREKELGVQQCEDHGNANGNGVEKKVGKKPNKKRRKGIDVISTAFKDKKGDLFRCLECPIAYHISCLHPNANFHELALLCHEHASTSKLPYLDVSQSLQGTIENKADELIAKIAHQKNGRKSSDSKKKIKNVNGLMQNPFLPGIKGAASGIASVDKHMGKLLGLATKNEDYIMSSISKTNTYSFCLPCGVRKEVFSKPPVYTHVHSNQYDPKNRPKRHPPSDEVCKCTFSEGEGEVKCDEHCMNRMMYNECIGNSETKVGEKNPYWNCNHGLDCGNRALGRRQFAKCKPQREQGKGWGLVTVKGVQKDGLVQEYAGEIIDEKTKKERLNEWAKDHPNDPNFYIMALEPGWFIDARVKGNLSRFINHSCRPNCRLVPVNVGGHTRVGIIANRNIKPGDFLCYDYQFDTRDRDKFVCRCGAENCRGSMKRGNKGKEGDEEDKKKTMNKKDTWLQAKIKFEKDRKFLQDIELDQLTRLNQVGINLPGEGGEGVRTVSAGPDVAALDKMRISRICLWRNVIKGSDFASRYLRATTSLPRKKMTKSLDSIDVLSLLK
uniref:Histone-lysine N-methyltransferase n=1 Tax=Chaetoceros debilis TaxID=122233 RepID=A0A7S3V9M3_9STRA